MLSTSYPWNTLMSIPIRTTNDGDTHLYSVQVHGAYLSHENFAEFSIYFEEWTNSGRKKKMTKLDK